MQLTLKRALTGAAVGALLLAGMAVAAQARSSGDDHSATSVTRSTDDRRSSEVRQGPAKGIFASTARVGSVQAVRNAITHAYCVIADLPSYERT